MILCSISSFNDEKQSTSITITNHNYWQLWNVQSHDQEESKLNNTIILNSSVYRSVYEKIIKKSMQ